MSATDSQKKGRRARRLSSASSSTAASPTGRGGITNWERSSSSYLRIVSNGVSTVRSAEASIASSIADSDKDAARDQMSFMQLRDRSEAALKTFKNCSAAGDASFVHEVEVIASVRHVNLVVLRGYCTTTMLMEGHQRIIICDLMKNGSLHDHLFGWERTKLSWPVRQNIAVGTARGLAYLHYGAQPTILHRDIKASIILLDEKFETKVADFGFGLVLLELLSGKKAFLSLDDTQNTLVTDWAWSLVRKGKPSDVIEEGMEELGPKEVMEKYVLVAVLDSRPQLHARLTMKKIVKILETDLAVPTIPDRPLPLVANMDEIERSISSSGSGQLLNFSGYQQFAIDVEVLIDRTESDPGTPG